MTFSRVPRCVSLRPYPKITAMQPTIYYNDAWEGVPLDFATDFIEFLQSSHPLRDYRLVPLAKCWRKEKYLVEEEVSSDRLWVIDLEKKKRIR